ASAMAASIMSRDASPDKVGRLADGALKSGNCITSDSSGHADAKDEPGGEQSPRPVARRSVGCAYGSARPPARRVLHRGGRGTSLRSRGGTTAYRAALAQPADTAAREPARSHAARAQQSRSEERRGGKGGRRGWATGD